MAFEISTAPTTISVVNNLEELRAAATAGDIFVSVHHRDQVIICCYVFREFRNPNIAGDQFLRLNSVAIESVDDYLFPLQKLPRGTQVTLTVTH